MRDVLTTVLEVAGLAAIVAGAATIDPSAGLIAGGCAAVLIGWLAG